MQCTTDNKPVAAFAQSCDHITVVVHKLVSERHTQNICSLNKDSEKLILSWSLCFSEILNKAFDY